jgi:hypothetical protein
MRRNTLISLVIMTFVLFAAAQQGAPLPDWKAFQFLVGDWVGEGSGSPGQGAGGFTFALELQGRVLVRHNRTEFPAGPDRPAFIHDDLLVVYQEKDGIKADYWDNEGHVIHYLVELTAEGLITFISEKQPGAPRLRLSYQRLGEARVDILFEMSTPDKPDDFKVYLHGKARRK